MKTLAAALQLLTSLPLHGIRTDDADRAAAIRWFPAAGLVVGLGVAGATWLGARVDPWAGALCGLIGWAALTGALHIDGLGDIADAAGAAHGDRSRLSAVLADPHIGSFGVTAIVLQLLAKLVLLRLAVQADVIPAVILIALVARIGPLVWTRQLRPLHQGLATRFSGGWTPLPLVLWGVIWLLSATIFPALLAAAFLIPAWGWWLRSRIGGISGDGHGAGIELVESALLAALVLTA